MNLDKVATLEKKWEVNVHKLFVEEELSETRSQKNIKRKARLSHKNWVAPIKNTIKFVRNKNLKTDKYS